MTEQNKDKITKQIKALLAMAASSTFENEAEAAAAKAHELMTKYQIEVSDVLADDPLDRSAPYAATSSSPSYKKHLWAAIARYYGCKSVISWKTNINYEVHIIGRESSRITTELMYPFILKQVREAGRKLANENGHKAEAMIRDVSNALVFRLSKLSAEQEAKAPTPSTVSGKNALIVTDALNALMEQLYPKLKSSAGRAIGTNGAASRAAEGISLARQTTHANVKRLK